MTSATPSKRGRGRPRKLLRWADYVDADPRSGVRVYLLLKAWMAAGDGKEDAIKKAITRFGWDRSTIQRKTKPFFDGESARHELEELIVAARADAAKRVAQLSADDAQVAESARAFSGRFDRIFSEEERRQLDGATAPFVLKLMDDRDESERSKQRRYHKSKKKSAAGKSAE